MYSLAAQRRKENGCWPLGLLLTYCVKPLSRNSYQMSLVTRKPVFGIFDQVRLKPSCSALEMSESCEIANKETRDIILSRQWTTKELIRLHGCASWAKTGFLRMCVDQMHWKPCSDNKIHVQSLEFTCCCDMVFA